MRAQSPRQQTSGGLRINQRKSGSLVERRVRRREGRLLLIGEGEGSYEDDGAVGAGRRQTAMAFGVDVDVEEATMVAWVRIY